MNRQLLLGFALSLLPRLAEACPACVGQRTSLSGQLKVVGVFLLVPFAIAAVVLRVVRNVGAGLDDDPQPLTGRPLPRRPHRPHETP